MATIRVNSDSMRAKAASFKQVADDIEGFTNEMSVEINKLKDFWTGDAGETLIEKFTGLKNDFENIVATIKQYSDFLEKSATAYDDAENTNLRGAQGQNY